MDGRTEPTATTGRWIDHAHRRVADAGLRAGAARSAVIEHLAQGTCLVTAQEVADALRRSGTGSTASVYRALDDLVRLGLVDRVHDQDGVARFEPTPVRGHHHHFIDDETGEVVPFRDEALEVALRVIADRLGVDISAHEVVLRGTSRSTT